MARHGMAKSQQSKGRFILAIIYPCLADFLTYKISYEPTKKLFFVDGKPPAPRCAGGGEWAAPDYVYHVTHRNVDWLQSGAESRDTHALERHYKFARSSFFFLTLPELFQRFIRRIIKMSFTVVTLVLFVASGKFISGF